MDTQSYVDTFYATYGIYPIMGADGADEPAESVEEEVEAPPATEAEAPAAAPEAPWSNDLAAAFEDEEVRGQVDAFMRQTVQPYVTKLEQERAGEPNVQANQLWEAFHEDAAGTFLAVATEIYGEDAAKQIQAALSGEAPSYDDVEFDEDDVDDELEDLPESLQEIVRERREQQQREAYDKELNRVRELNPDVEVNEELFAPFVVSAEGDFDIAMATYKEFVNKFKAQGSSEPAQPNIDNEALRAAVAPPTLGSESNPGGTTTPPVTKKYESIDAAMDDFFAEIS